MKVFYSEKCNSDNVVKMLRVGDKIEGILIEVYELKNNLLKLVSKSFNEQIKEIKEENNPLLIELIYYINNGDSIGIVNTINKF